MQSFKMIFSGVTILQGVEFPIFPIDFAWALQQCSATALPVIDAARFIPSRLAAVNELVNVWPSRGSSVAKTIGRPGLDSIPTR